MKKTASVFLFLLLAASGVFAGSPKYIFLFIGDGMAAPQRLMAEEFSRKAGLGDIAMNHFPVRTNTRTQSANSLVTDSAASATAIACGGKTCNGMLGVDPSTNRFESVAEFARKAGRKVGIMTTVTIVHATPAGFYAHRPSRGMSYAIALDLVASGFDYFAGGGVYDSFDDKKDPDYRGNVFDLARAAGYKVTIDDKAAWRALKPGTKSWSVFGAKGMPYSIDSRGDEPTIAELLEKGIELLEGPEGFFIMCEGGKIDHAGHANDAAANMRDLIAFDKAVRVALDFQAAHPDETLIVTTGDHETGGLSMGFAGVGGAFRVELLAKQTMSVSVFSEKMKKRMADAAGKISFDDVKDDLRAAFGFVFPGDGAKPGDPMLLSSGEVRVLRSAFDQDVALSVSKVSDSSDYMAPRSYIFAQTAGHVLASHAGVSWSTGSHTALPTLTTAKGPCAGMFSGISDNTQISTTLKKIIAGGCR